MTMIFKISFLDFSKIFFSKIHGFAYIKKTSYIKHKIPVATYIVNIRNISNINAFLIVKYILSSHSSDTGNVSIFERKKSDTKAR